MIATLETAQRIEYTERRLFTISPLPRFRQYSPMSLILYSATLSPTLPPHLYKTTRCIFLFFLSLSLSRSLYIPSALFFILPLAFSVPFGALFIRRRIFPHSPSGTSFSTGVFFQISLNLAPPMR